MELSLALSLNFGVGPLVEISGRAEYLDSIQDILEGYEGQLGRLVWSREEDRLTATRGILTLLRHDPRLDDEEHRSQEVRSAAPLVPKLLRPFQAEAVDAVARQQFCTGIIKSPTGSGKTRMCAGLMSVIGGPWLYVAPNSELMFQGLKSIKELVPQMLKELDADHGVLVLGGTYGVLPIDPPPTVDRWAGVLFDEVHCLPTASRVDGCFSTVADYYVGLSATPLNRQDDKNGLTVSLCGPVVHDVPIKILEEEGFLARGKVTRIIV